MKERRDEERMVRKMGKGMWAREEGPVEKMASGQIRATTKVQPVGGPLWGEEKGAGPRGKCLWRVSPLQGSRPVHTNPNGHAGKHTLHELENIQTTRNAHRNKFYNHQINTNKATITVYVISANQIFIRGENPHKHTYKMCVCVSSSVQRITSGNNRHMRIKLITAGVLSSNTED